MTKEKKHLPLWSKALIFLVLLVFGSFLFTVTRAIIYTRHIIVTATEPENIKRCAELVASFPQPLPAGYTYTCGVNLDVMNSVLLVAEHTEDKQKIIFFCHLKDDPDAVDAKQLLDRAFDLGIVTDTTAAKFTDVKTKGELPIGSDKMLYMTGVLKDQAGSIYEGLVGCIRNASKRKSVLVYSLSPPGKSLNLDNCFNLLKTLPSI